MLTAFIHAVAFDRSSVDDIFQETVLTAWQRLDEFDPNRPFGPWLRGIARNHILSSARRGRRYRSHLDELAQQRVDGQIEQIDASTGDTFSERLETLRGCIAGLSPEARDAVDLVYLRGLDSTVAAQSAGVNQEAFRKRLYRARLALAECLRAKSVFAPASEAPR